MSTHPSMLKVRIYNFHEKLIEVHYFQLLQWIGAINLETQGMKMSRGSVTAHVRRILSCPPRHPRALILEHLRTSQKDIKEQLAAIAKE